MGQEQLSGSEASDLIWVCRHLADALQGDTTVLRALDAISETAPPRARRLLHLPGEFLRLFLQVPLLLRELVQFRHSKTKDETARSNVTYPGRPHLSCVFVRGSFWSDTAENTTI